MENFGKKSENFRPEAKYTYSDKVKEIALEASEMKEFRDVVGSAKSKVEAIRAVRELLPHYFPEIKEIPEPKIERAGIFPPAPNDFMIAKNIVDLLYKNKD